MPAPQSRATTAGADLFSLTAPFVGNGRKAVFAIARLQGDAVRAMMACQMEALTFLRHRCEQDIRFFDKLIATRELSDAADLYGDFCEAAIADYSREAVKLANMAGESSAASDQAVPID